MYQASSEQPPQRAFQNSTCIPTASLDPSFGLSATGTADQILKLPLPPPSSTAGTWQV